MEAGTAKDVYAAAAGGDPTARELVDDVGRRLAWAVHLLVMTYDVDHVVVGGGVSHAGSAFSEPIHRELERLRAVSSQAGELLPAHIVEVLPPEAEPGAWGAVAVASAVRDRNGEGNGGGPSRLNPPRTVERNRPRHREKEFKEE